MNGVDDVEDTDDVRLDEEEDNWLIADALLEDVGSEDDTVLCTDDDGWVGRTHFGKPLFKAILSIRRSFAHWRRGNFIDRSNFW